MPALNFWDFKFGINLRPQSGSPTSPSNGDVYYDSGTNKFKFYENGSFVNYALSTGGYSNGGNAFGGAASLGTTDNFALSFITNNATALSISNTQVATFSSTVNLLAQSELRLQDTTGGEYVGLRASGTQATYTITLPAAAPASNTFLQYNGTNYVWATPSASVTFPLSGTAGSQSAPTYSFGGSSDATTGMFSAGAGNISFSSSGTETFRIGSTGNLSVLNQAEVRFFDSGSAHLIKVVAPAVAANYTITLPAAAPATNTFLKYNGTNYIWSTITASGDINNGGNTFGSNITIGTNDNFTTSLLTNGVARLTATNAGVTLPSQFALQLNNSANTFNTSIRAGANAANYTITLPAAAPATSTFLSFDGTNYVWASAGGGSFPLLAPGASASAPSYSFSGDTGTGIWSVAAGNMNIALSGTDVIRLGPGNIWNFYNRFLVRLWDTGTAAYVGLQAPSAVSATYTITLPAAAPTTNQFLHYTGSAYDWVEPVRTLNSLVGAITLSAGTGISLTPSGNTITVAVTGALTFPILGTAGTVGAPTYSFGGSSDATTGMWSVASGNISFSNSGAETIRIGPTGNFSILNNAELRLFDNGTANLIKIKTASTTANYTITLPSSAPASNTFLEYDGTNYVWAASPIALTAFGSTPNANGLSVSGQTLNMQPADGTNPGGVSTTTQTFAGAKTFSSPVTANSFIPTSNTVPANGLYRQAANNIAFSTNTTYTGDITSTGAWNIGPSANGQFSFTNDGTSPNFIYNSGANFTPIAQPTFMYSGTNAQSIRIAGGNSSTAGGSVRLYGGTHATLPNVSEFYNTGALTLTLSAANNVSVENGDLKVNTVGKTLFIKEGTNGKMGVSTLVAGTVTVSTTAVTSTSRIQLTIQSLGTVAVPQAIGVTARTAGTSFVITSAALTDTSVVAWVLFEPA